MQDVYKRQGEGTQTAARRAGVNLMRADAICLTHYHGDHIFGLPGLLQTLGAQGRTRPLVLLGPEGLLEVWRAVYALTGPLPYAVKPLVCRAGQPVDVYKRQDLDRVQPVVTLLPGWNKDISGCRSWTELPKEAKAYVEFLEKQLGHEIQFVSTGAEREKFVLKGEWL